MNIILIGNSGCGKSAVGLALAKKLFRPFVDTDEAIHRFMNDHPSSIIRQFSLGYFREQESKLLRMSLKDDCIVSTGAGVIDFVNNLSVLEDHTLIYLKASVETLWARIKDDDKRPLSSSLEDVRKLCSRRNPIYEKIMSITVEVDGKTVDEIVHDICSFSVI